MLGPIDTSSGELVYSEHAERRCQQRGIGEEVICAVYEFGTAIEHHGSKKYFMDKKGHARARRGMSSDSYKRIADRLNVYLVVNRSVVVTVARMRSRVRTSKPYKQDKPRRR